MIERVDQPALFDYAVLDTETRAFVQKKAQAIHARLKQTAEGIVSIGQSLMAVKERLGHGQFTPWLKAEFGMSIDTAQDFMRVARRFGEKNWNFQHLPVSVLYELAAPSTPESIVQMVETGHVRGGAHATCFFVERSASMNIFLILLCIAPFAILAIWGIVRLVRWVLAYVAWWSSE